MAVPFNKVFINKKVQLKVFIDILMAISDIERLSILNIVL